MPSPAIDGLHKTSLCRRSPEGGTTTDASVVWLPTSRTAMHQRHRRAGRHATTIDAPTRVQPHADADADAPPLFRRASQNLAAAACCCLAARRQRPPRSDRHANN
jgi:hypothetical protein